MKSRPLEGLTILVAASEGRLARLAEGLREKGARVLGMPTMRIVPPSDLRRLDRALEAWSEYDWVVFTSSYGVEAVIARAREVGLDLGRFHGRIAAVGPATKAAVESAGLPVDVVPNEYVTDEIAEALGDVRGKGILLPRSRLARRSLAGALRRRRADVTEVEAYDAVPAAADLPSLRRVRRVDFLVFTSAASVSNFALQVPPDLLERLRRTANAVCIGPVTAEAARAQGFHVTVTAKSHTFDGLIEDLIKEARHG